MALSDDILRFANSNLGTKVGTNGECWDLAHQALIAAHADTSRNLQYIWGTTTSIVALTSGDIIQFENYSATLRVTNDEEELEQSWGTQHHTAIVSQILNAERGYVEVLHQNWESIRRVTRERFYIRNGVTEYQGSALGITGTVRITVSGTIRLYHAH